MSEEGDRTGDKGMRMRGLNSRGTSEYSEYVDMGLRSVVLASDRSVTVQSSRFTTQDTAFDVLAANGVEGQVILQVLEASRNLHALSKINAGHRYEVAVGEGGLQWFVVQVGETEQVRVYRAASGVLRARLEKIPFEVRLVRLEAEVRDSLFGAVARGGGSPGLTEQISDIFGWVVDFYKDLRKGDRIRLLVERRFLEGNAEGFGRILGAELHIGGKKHVAIHFGSGGGDYFTPEGENLRRPFLRSPLRYTRISSRFSARRFHPILKRFRSHFGVDYAAPVGTPVRTVADGTVAWAGWKGAAGKAVRVRHIRGYETSYLHLSRFAPGVRGGGRVRQGQVIGYVGSTGLSTGPHLDFRVTRNGRPINPLSSRMPAGTPVPSGLRKEFDEMLSQREVQFAQAPLVKGGPTELAANRRVNSHF